MILSSFNLIKLSYHLSYKILLLWNIGLSRNRIIHFLPFLKLAFLPCAQILIFCFYLLSSIPMLEQKIHNIFNNQYLLDRVLLLCNIRLFLIMIIQSQCTFNNIPQLIQITLPIGSI